MSGVRMLHFLKDSWKLIQIPQYYTMALNLFCGWPFTLQEYCIHHIFQESNFSRIGTSRHFCEWLNLRSRRAMDREISIIHSFARALCTVLLVLRTQIAFMRRDRR